MTDMNQFNAAIDIKVNDLKWSGKLQEVVGINVSDLDGDLSNQPGIVSWFGVVLAEAIASSEDLKDQRDRVYARLYLRYREQDEIAKVKSTEARINSLVLTDPDYVGVQERFNYMRKQMNTLKSLSASLDHRRDMLIQLSANIRKEHSSGDYGFDGKE